MESHTSLPGAGLDGRQPDASATPRRKAEHIQINLAADVQAKGVTSGLERYRLVHQVLPELDLGKVDTATRFLGATCERRC